MKILLHRIIAFLAAVALAGCSNQVGSDGQTTAPADNGGATSNLSQAEIDAFLGVHNKARSEVGVGDIKYSTKLASYAQAWADHLASTGCKMKHRPYVGQWSQQHGENIAFMGRGSTAENAALMWYGEKSNFNNTPLTTGNLHSIGHYTQMVWKSTKRVGIGKAVCANGTVIIVANYDPAGNLFGSYPY